MSHVVKIVFPMIRSGELFSDRELVLNDDQYDKLISGDLNTLKPIVKDILDLSVTAEDINQIRQAINKKSVYDLDGNIRNNIDAPMVTYGKLLGDLKVYNGFVKKSPDEYLINLGYEKPISILNGPTHPVVFWFPLVQNGEMESSITIYMGESLTKALVGGDELCLNFIKDQIYSRPISKRDLQRIRVAFQNGMLTRESLDKYNRIKNAEGATYASLVSMEGPGIVENINLSTFNYLPKISKGKPKPPNVPNLTQDSPEPVVNIGNAPKQNNQPNQGQPRPQNPNQPQIRTSQQNQGQPRPQGQNQPQVHTSQQNQGQPKQQNPNQQNQGQQPKPQNPNQQNQGQQPKPQNPNQQNQGQQPKQQNPNQQNQGQPKQQNPNQQNQGQPKQQNPNQQNQGQQPKPQNPNQQNQGQPKQQNQGQPKPQNQQLESEESGESEYEEAPLYKSTKDEFEPDRKNREKTRINITQLFEKKTFKRAGVVPIFTKDNKEYYLFGIDRRFNEITDFGGTVERWHHEDHYDAALRELSEETLELLDYRGTDILDKATSIDDGEMIIFFCPMKITHRIIGEYKELYEEAYKNCVEQYGQNFAHKCFPENKGLIAMTRKEIVEALYKNKNDKTKLHFYNRVGELLKKKFPKEKSSS